MLSNLDLTLNPSKLNQDIEKLKDQTKDYKRNFVLYLVEQKKYLIKLVDFYQNKLNILVKFLLM